MSEVVAFRRFATMLWSPAEGEVLPVHGLRELEAHVGAWLDYGQTAMIHRQPSDDREVRVTALGDDGWLVKVHDTGMVKGGWSYSKPLTRLLEDGSLPGFNSDSPWYIPDESTDLAGSVFLTEQIQFDPALVAQAAWAWLTGMSMPSGHELGTAGYDHVVCNSVAEALTWITNSSEESWPDEAAQVTIELAAELATDRIIVTSPGQITVRVEGADRRVRFQHRSRDDAQVRVIGMTDELGHKYTMTLPGREILRISRQRSPR